MRRILIPLVGFSILVGLSFVSEAQVLDLLWSLSPGDRSYLTADNTQRGMTYNPATGHILVVNRAGGLSVNRLDAATGADLGTLDVTGISGGTFALNMITAGSDGAIYACNLTTDSQGATVSTGPFKLYRWANESAAPELAYSGDPSGGDLTASNRRFGDTLDVRGAGGDVQVLTASRAGTMVSVILQVAPGVFNAFPVNSDAPAGDLGLGLAFGSGNTFWATAPGRILRQLEVNPTTFFASTLQAFDLDTAGIPTSLAVLGVDPVNNLLGAINLNTSPTVDSLLMYDLDTLSPSAMNFPVDAVYFRVDNANANGTGAVDFGGDMVFALDSNNGLLAYSVVPEPSTIAFALLGGLGLALALRRHS